MKIYLVENSSLLVERMSKRFRAIPGIEVVGNAAGAAQAIREILEVRPQIALLDINLDEGSGFDVLNAVRRGAPDVECYMLTNYVSPALQLLAEQLGASGYYDKTKDFEKLRALVARRATQELS